MLRQENYFRFGGQRFALDAHGTYACLDEGTTRMVLITAKEETKLVQQSAREHRDAVANTVKAATLAISTPDPGAAGGQHQADA